jgi:hypothetical protein
MNREVITIREIESDNGLEDVFARYEKGDDTEYEVLYNDGTSSGCLLIKYKEELQNG